MSQPSSANATRSETKSNANANGVDPLEMEPLSTKGGTSSGAGADLPPSLVALLLKAEQLLSLARMYAYRYPRASIGAAGGIASLLLIKLLFFRHRGEVLYQPPHIVAHFGDFESFYDTKVNDVDHWCLIGGDDQCVCSDPTEATPRFGGSGEEEEEGPKKEDSEGKGHHSWIHLHNEHVEAVDDRIKKWKKRQPDVVFIGDEVIELMSGSISGHKINKLEKLYNQTFSTDGKPSRKPGPGEVTGTTKDYPLDGLSLGINGDTSANVLWRIQNGAIPKDLKPKVFWLYVGSNDLTRLRCSEDVVSLGILRAAEEIARYHVESSVVVIQGLLPQSPFPDGSLTHSHRSGRMKLGHHHSNDAYYVKSDQIPLWPSIEAINNELETFCASHTHIVYFDAASIFLGSMGNEHYQSSQKKIIQELMENGRQPTLKGFEVMNKAISEEVKRIIGGDEHNFKTKNGQNRNLR